MDKFIDNWRQNKNAGDTFWRDNIEKEISHRYQ